jgi:hypothetical protein
MDAQHCPNSPAARSRSELLYANTENFKTCPLLGPSEVLGEKAELDILCQGAF